MDNQTTLQKLNEKVLTMLQQYHSLKGENEMLRTELVTLKAEGEVKSQKDLEIEEIVEKIESIMG